MGRWIDVTVDEGSMRAYLAEPKAPSGAGVLACMHGPGIDAFLQDICERLAARGYTVIAPEVYHRQPPPLDEPWTKVRDAEALRDMAAAIGALVTSYGVDPERTGAVGFCMGGRLAFLHAANAPKLRAAVIFHGGNIMVARDMASPLAQAKGICAPLLGLFGADDKNPAPADVAAIGHELDRLGKAHDFVVYEGAGHAFLNFTRPEVYREQQAKDAWARAVAFLARWLPAAKDG